MPDESLLCACGCGHPRPLFIHSHKGRGKPYDMAARFWEKVDKRGPDECWEWQAGRVAAGYGQFRLGSLSGDTRTNERSHRVAWELTNGPIPDGLFVLHRCDNPPCCNPGHLFLGTHADNHADMWAKGRGSTPIAHREDHPNAKLTDAQAREIRSRATGRHGEQTALAKEFGVSPTLIRKLIRGESWRTL